MSTFRGNNFEVAILGAAAVDWVAQVDELPHRDGITWANTYEPYPGGSGGNVASALARLGKSVRFLGRFGDDEGGKILLDRFLKDGVDTSAIRIEAGQRTSSCFIAVDTNGDREIVGLGGIALYEDPTDLSPKWFEELKVLVIADAYIKVALTAIEFLNKEAKVIFNPGGLMAEIPAQEIDPLLSKTYALIVSRGEAEKMTKCRTAGEAIRALASRGPKVVIITQGAEGALLWDGERISTVPAFKVEKIVDTTGAGDAFTAGLITGLLNHLDWISSAKLGNAVSSIKIAHFGARSGIPNMDQVTKFIQNKEIIREEVNK